MAVWKTYLLQKKKKKKKKKKKTIVEMAVNSAIIQ